MPLKIILMTKMILEHTDQENLSDSWIGKEDMLKMINFNKSQDKTFIITFTIMMDWRYSIVHLDFDFDDLN